MKKPILFVLAILFYPSCVLFGESAAPSPSPAAASATPVSSATVPSAPSAPPAALDTHADHPGKKREIISGGLGDVIILKFKTWPDPAGGKKTPNDSGEEEKTLDDLILYIDCIPLKGLHPVAICYEAKELRFSLERNKDNEKQWQLLIQSRKDEPVSVGVGLENDPKHVTMALQKMRLLVFKNDSWAITYRWIAGILVGGIALLLLIYGAYSNLLRDLSPLKESEFKQTPHSTLKILPGLGGKNRTGKDRPPFSLARVQMAFWFAIIVAAYLFLWLVLGERNSFNSTALTLLGISLGTGLVARAIDTSKQGDINQLKAERDGLAARQKELEAKAQTQLTTDEQKELAAAKARIEEIDKEIKHTTVAADEHKTEGFFTDILSDENGISLQRLQMLGWTLVLGLIFVAEVKKSLSMPVFDSTLLGLMGISSGAFIGFKLPETKTTVDSPK